MTYTGSGKPGPARRPAGEPRLTMSSTRSSAIRAIAGRRAVIRLAVNHLPTRRRQCRCASRRRG
ncbi:hypothetical protein ACFFMN_39355 [Planobispora siamensis]|uniref:hypothetical protein n=1 Tax=Planobispora siamensis TaxID=936338 RepID=UPI00194E12B3|nr:hypothetical protein [Planobispora siamensis]